MIETISMCPSCGEIIPAIITVGDSVVMSKECQNHGSFSSIVERDHRWWTLCRDMGCNNIYDGYMLDITGQCNLNCQYCYHDKKSNHLLTEDIIQNALKHKHLGPTILTGGEPTLHPDLPKIINRLHLESETWILTNGTVLSSEQYFDEICEAGLLINGIVLAGLSLHKESTGKDLELLELCKSKKYKIGTVFIVIDSIEQMENAVYIAGKYKDVICSFRIKAASNLWNESNSINRIFISDMLKWLGQNGKTELVHTINNKNSYANVLYNGQHIILVSWYDIYNVDLKDIDCGPWYTAKDGTINNLVTTCLKNGIPT